MRWHCPPDTGFEIWAWRSEAEHATALSLGLLIILHLCEWAGKKHCVSLKLECQIGGRTSDLWLSKQAALTTAPGLPWISHEYKSSPSHNLLFRCVSSAWCSDSYYRDRILNPESGDQSRHILLIIPRGLTWPSLACTCIKV